MIEVKDAGCMHAHAANNEQNKVKHINVAIQLNSILLTSNRSLFVDEMRSTIRAEEISIGCKCFMCVYACLLACVRVFVIYYSFCYDFEIF